MYRRNSKYFNRLNSFEKCEKCYLYTKNVITGICSRGGCLHRDTFLKMEKPIHLESGDWICCICKKRISINVNKCYTCRD